MDRRDVHPSETDETSAFTRHNLLSKRPGRGATRPAAPDAFTRHTVLVCDASIGLHRPSCQRPGRGATRPASRDVSSDSSPSDRWLGSSGTCGFRKFDLEALWADRLIWT